MFSFDQSFCDFISAHIYSIVPDVPELVTFHHLLQLLNMQSFRIYFNKISGLRMRRVT